VPGCSYSLFPYFRCCFDLNAYFVPLPTPGVIATLVFLLAALPAYTSHTLLHTVPCAFVCDLPGAVRGCFTFIFWFRLFADGTFTTPLRFPVLTRCRSTANGDYDYAGCVCCSVYHHVWDANATTPLHLHASTLAFRVPTRSFFPPTTLAAFTPTVLCHTARCRLHSPTTAFTTDFILRGGATLTAFTFYGAYRTSSTHSWVLLILQLYQWF